MLNLKQPIQTQLVMARQTGVVGVKGTIGDITFYKSKDGDLARKKTSLDRDQVMNDPAFKGSRKAMSEFGRASSASKLLRKAFSEHTEAAKDHSTHYRCNTAMATVLRLDTTSAKGKRKVHLGNVRHLAGFQWNSLSHLNNILRVQEQVTMNPGTGGMKVIIPSLVATTGLDVPSGATHFKVVFAGAALALETEKLKQKSQESGYLPINDSPTGPLALTVTVSTTDANLLCAGLGIQFFILSGGNYLPMKGKAAFGLVGVETLVKVPVEEQPVVEEVATQAAAPVQQMLF